MDNTIFELIEKAYFAAINTNHEIKTIENYNESSELVERIDKITSSLKKIGFDYEANDEDFMFFMGEKIEDIAERALEIVKETAAREALNFCKRSKANFLGNFECDEGEYIPECIVEVEHGDLSVQLIYSVSNSSSFDPDIHSGCYIEYDHSIRAELQSVGDVTGTALTYKDFTNEDWEFLENLGIEKCM